VQHLPTVATCLLLQVHAALGSVLINSSRTATGVLPLLQQSMAHPYDIFIVNFGE
jgi:hypothetical protein